MNITQRSLTKDQVLCREGDDDTDLYLIEEGEVLVCIRKGSQVTPIAYLGVGEFIGELSFFDGLARGADIIATRPTKLSVIPAESLRNQFPSWIGILGKVLASKIRHMDNIIRQNGIKKSKDQSVKPIEISEQTRLFRILTK